MILVSASVVMMSSIWLVFLLGSPSRLEEMRTRLYDNVRNKTMPTKKDTAFVILFVFAAAVIISLMIRFLEIYSALLT
ncbi:MAG: hypothetical protein EB830_04585 [Nitrosopumilus sp. H13]|nr:MAG: hypothetical protein EB830_04585 [Nitrosopumilus sp. H13]